MKEGLDGRKRVEKEKKKGEGEKEVKGEGGVHKVLFGLVCAIINHLLMRHTIL